jgi:hypothetical protein
MQTSSLDKDVGSGAPHLGGAHRVEEGVALPLVGVGAKLHSIRRSRPIPDVAHAPNRLADRKTFAQIGAFELVRREIQGGSDNFFLG